ncbi:MAG: hypothetical protein M1828_005629 [Chrysothrix sp. TS-e1954]|nr:MAG: hypothetical protein M1828_005629 [Chrysothrix sp. TS-e1954]
MELEADSVLTALEPDEETGALVRVRWTLESIHETNMSTVFLATNEQQGQRIVKRIMSSKLSKNELGALVGLNASRKRTRHLFVQLDQWYEHFGQVYCMMEYLEMGDLASYQKRRQPSEQDIQRIARQVLQALQEMHALGITHRDIKPSNILMSSEDPPSIKICDFGISKQQYDALNYTNTDSKTSAYAAPEVLRLNTSNIDDYVDNKVDMWALGCVIAELATGRVLFRELSTTEVFCRSPREREATLRILTEELSSSGAEIVAELLLPDPKERPSAQEALSRSWLCKTLPLTVSSGQNGSNALRKSHDVASSKSTKTALPKDNVETQYEDSTNGLWNAAIDGDIAMVDHFKKLGHDAGVKDLHGATPMHCAAANGNIAIVDYLKKLGQDIGVKNIDEAIPMHYAAAEGQIAMVDHLQKLGQDIEARDDYGSTPMHVAAATGEIGMVDHLSKIGQDIGVRDNDGSTPMHVAAATGEIAMVDYLEKLGQDIGVRDDFGRTPHDVALSYGQMAVANHLNGLIMGQYVGSKAADENRPPNELSDKRKSRQKSNFSRLLKPFR